MDVAVSSIGTREIAITALRIGTGLTSMFRH
jgi:hypothetical protein